MTHIIKNSLIILLVIFICSCNRENQPEEIKEFVIFGTSGFCLKDKQGNSYTSTYWIDCDSCNTKHLEYDSTKLDIRQYFEYKKGEEIKIAIRKPKSKTEYHKLSTQDILGFNELINSTLLNRTYKNNYTASEPIIYDGWAYTLYYKTSKGKEKIINYIPNYLPDSLRILHNIVRETTPMQSQIISKSFKYNQIVNDESIKQYVRNPPPVLPLVKFPKIIIE